MPAGLPSVCYPAAQSPRSKCGRPVARGAPKRAEVAQDVPIRVDTDGRPIRLRYPHRAPASLPRWICSRASLRRPRARSPVSVPETSRRLSCRRTVRRWLAVAPLPGTGDLLTSGTSKWWPAGFCTAGMFLPGSFIYALAHGQFRSVLIHRGRRLCGQRASAGDNAVSGPPGPLAATLLAAYSSRTLIKMRLVSLTKHGSAASRGQLLWSPNERSNCAWSQLPARARRAGEADTCCSGPAPRNARLLRQLYAVPCPENVP